MYKFYTDNVEQLLQKIHLIWFNCNVTRKYVIFFMFLKLF